MNTNQLEQKILEDAEQQPVRPSLRKLAAVNGLRHSRMDGIVFNVKDDSRYLEVYLQVMHSISTDYPFLSQEVERQVSKKIRRQARYKQEGKETHE